MLRCLALLLALLWALSAFGFTPHTWNNTTYQIPDAGDRNWGGLTQFLTDVASNGQTTNKQMVGVRVATTTPVTISAASDYAIVTNMATPGPVAVNLPSGVLGQVFTVIDGKGDASTNNITITPAAGLINGNASYAINVNRAGVALVYDGTGWTVVNEFTTASGGSGNIARSKLAAGTADQVIINDGSGNISSEAQLAKSRGGAGADMSSVTFPVSGTLVTEAGVETLTGKTLTTPTIAQILNSGTLTLPTATGTLATWAGTEALSNKTLGVTDTLTGATAASFANGGATVTLPTFTGTLATWSGVETLTNKTISGAANTLTNIPLGTAMTGTLAASNGGTGVGSSTGSGGSVVLSTSPSLTTPIIGAPTWSSFGDLTQIATPAAPGSGKDRVYVKSDDNLYVQTSAGLEKQVGSGGGGTGSGEKNYIPGSGQSTAATWGVSGAGVTATTDTTAADLPDPTLSSALLVTGASGSTDYAFQNFTLDPADYNKKLKVQADQACGLSGAAAAIANCASGNFRVDVYSCTVAWSGTPATTCSGTATRLPLSTDSSSVSALPALTGTYRTTFDSPGAAAKYMQLRVGLNTTTTHAVAAANVVVGPGVVVQGAAVSEWQSFTPTWSTGALSGSPSFSVFKWRRVGDVMEIEGQHRQSSAGTGGSGTYLLTLPGSHTIAANGLDPASVSGILGYFNVWEGTNFYAGNVIASSSTALEFHYKTAANTETTWASTTISMANTSLRVEFKLFIPIAEWAGSGTVNVASNDVEYAYSTSTLTTAGGTQSDDGNYGYGPAGAQFNAIAGTSLSSATKLRVRFATPIQQSDRLVLEIYDNGAWGGVADTPGDVCALTSQNSANFGMGIQPISGSSTDVYVVFGNSGRLPNSSSFGSATGSGWSGISANPIYKWRIRKERAGAAVGFGIVSGTSSGLVPASNTNLDNASATRLGLMQYLSSGSYNGGGAPTVTLVTGGGTLSSVTRGVFIPYQTNDGTWRLKFSLTLATSSTSRTIATFGVNGVTAKNVANFYQPVEANTTTGSQSTAGYWTPNTGNMTADHSTATTSALYVFGGDIELDSKPTWAY